MICEVLFQKGSEDDLIQWTKHSQLVHSQNFGEEKHYDIKVRTSATIIILQTKS